MMLEYLKDTVSGFRERIAELPYFSVAIILILLLILTTTSLADKQYEFISKDNIQTKFENNFNISTEDTDAVIYPDNTPYTLHRYPIDSSKAIKNNFSITKSDILANFEVLDAWVQKVESKVAVDIIENATVKEKRTKRNLGVKENKLDTAKGQEWVLTIKTPRYVTGNFSIISMGIDPDVLACGTLSTANAIYTQTADITSGAGGDCIVIGAENITFNGAGYSIRYTAGVGGAGIRSNSKNTTVLNANVHSFTYGLQLANNYMNGLIRDSNFTNNARALQGITINYTFRNLNLTNTTWSASYLIDFNTGSENNSFVNVTGNGSTSGISIDGKNNTFINVSNEWGYTQGGSRKFYTTGKAQNTTHSISNIGWFPYPISSGSDVGSSGTNTSYYNITATGRNWVDFSLNTSIPGYWFNGSSVNQAPVMASVRISPAPTALSTQDLLGYANATDPDGNNVTYNCRWYKDSVLNYTCPVYPSSTQGVERNTCNITSGNLSIGQAWILECLANDTLLTSAYMNSSNTTITATAINSEAYLTSANETIQNAINISIDHSTGLVNFTANVTYNGTTYIGTQVGSNFTTQNFSANVTPSIIPTNTTDFQFNWTYGWNYANGTYSSASGNTHNQTVFYIFKINSTATSPYPNVTEGSTITASANVSIFNPNALANYTFIVYVNTSSNTSGLYENSTTIAAPTITDPATPALNYTVTHAINVSYLGMSYLRNYSPTVNITVNNLVLSTDCSNGTPIMNFTFYNQANLTEQIPTNIEATFWINEAGSPLIVNQSFAVNNSANTSICFASGAGAGTLYVNSTMSFIGANGSFRKLYFYQINDAIAVGTMKNYSLYNLLTAGSTATQYTIYRAANAFLTDGYVSIYRYYPSINDYLLVSMGKTDNNGQATSYLVPINTNYRYNLLDSSGSSLTLTSTGTLSCDPAATLCSVSLAVETNVTDLYSTFYSGIFTSNQSGCAYDNSTYIISCYNTNPTGTGSNFTLTVWKFGNASNTVVCYNVSANATGTISCVLPDHNANYYYQARLTIGSYGWVANGLIELNKLASVFGITGLFMTVLIVFSLGVLGVKLGGFSAAAILSVVGLFFSTLLGFVFVDGYVLAAIAFIALIIGHVLRN